MHLHTEVFDAEIPRIIDAFIAITGIEEWERRFIWLDTQRTQNDFLRDYIGQIYALELEFARVCKEIADTGRVGIRADTVERYRLFAFVTGVTSIYERLSPLGQKRLRGMILGGLRDSGLTPLQQEMSVAAHLFSRGFDVVFSDMETGSGFDFLATKDGVELEVECKRVGLSLGRKIPRLETLNLHKHIHAQVKPLFARLNCGLFLRVVLPGRLTANEPDQKAIASVVGKACRTGVTLAQQFCDVEVHEFQIQGTPFEQASGQADMPSIRTFMEKRFNVKNREMYVLGEKGKRALAVSLESRQSDSLVENLFSELSDSAARQFSKTKPGVLCVQFIDLTNEQIRRMGSASDDALPKRPSYILLETSKFLASPKRSHIHSAVFRGRGDVGKSASIRGNLLTHHVQEEGSAFFVINENHALANDRRYAIFGDASPPSRIMVES